jgi:CBS domain containing-hemolysin-like protein
MSKTFHAIPTHKLKSHCGFMHPPELPEVTHIHDSALSAMIDFKYHTPPTISAHKSLEEALTEMRIFHLPVLLVIDTEKNIIGVITSEDILGEKPVKISQEKRIPRSEIEVEMVMLSFRNAVALDIEDLTHAKVGHIIQTFRETKQHTLLVMKSDTQKLRGLFSASLISRQLDKDITEVMSEAESIAELQHDLHL